MKSSRENRIFRKHRKHCAIEQPNQQRRDGVYRRGRPESAQVKLARGKHYSRPAQLTKPPAARRLIAYQMLWNLIEPVQLAGTDMAMPPAMPPLIPAVIL